jgi:NADPH2:quinone reductase
MRAIRVSTHGGPEVLKLEEVPKPSPGPDQVLVKIHMIGVNPVDTYIRSGAYTTKTLPYTPGFDASGVIESVGAQVTQFKAGDRVYTSSTVSGAYAEYAVCHPGTVHPLPPGITFGQGAAIGIPYATAYRALFQKANARAGESVLVHGASGGVGTAAVQLARAAGLMVVGTSSSAEGQQLVQENGAHHVLNHRVENYREELMRLTSKRGFDVILEMLANVNLSHDLSLLAKFGRVVVIGSRGKIEIDPRDTMSRDASILGMTLFNAAAQDLASIHMALYAGLENETLRPIIGKELALDQAAQAHIDILEPGAYGKIILVP